jgi:hypothetical protein
MEPKIKIILDRAGIAFDEKVYRPALVECWKCKNQIVVFDWLEKEMFDEKEPPEEGRPKTIKLMFSKTVSKEYWANTCLSCGSIQGDFFLFEEPDGPFGLLNDEEKQKAYKEFVDGMGYEAPSGSNAQVNKKK